MGLSLEPPEIQVVKAIHYFLLYDHGLFHDVVNWQATGRKCPGCAIMEWMDVHLPNHKKEWNSCDDSDTN